MAKIEIEIGAIDTASKVVEGVGRAFGGLGGIASGALSVALGNVLTPAIQGVEDAFGGLVSSAMENEQMQTRLAGVIKSTGGAAGLTLDAANNLGKQFQSLAGGTDDTVLAIEEMGLRMGTISAKDMPNFIQTTLDLAAATGQDATTAARTLAQAYDDPESALARFNKMGIRFTDDQKAQIKSMMDAGDQAGAFALVMGRLGEATGGAALANTQTMQGQMDELKNRFGEAAETIGTALLPIAHELFDAVIAPAIPVIESLAGSLAGSVPGALAAVQTAFQNALPVIQPIIDAAQNVGAAFGESMPMIQRTVGEMVTFVIGQVNILGPTLIANIASTLNTIAAFWRAHGDEVMTVVKFAFEFITVTIGGALTLASGIISAAVTLITGIWSAGSAMLKGDTAGAWAAIQATFETVSETIKTTLTAFMNSVLSIVGMNMDTFKAAWQGDWDLVKTIVGTTWDNIIAGIREKVTTFVSAITTGIQNAIDTARTTIAGFIDIGRGIIDSMRDGINGAIQDLIDAAIAAIQAAIAAARRALGMSSPARVMVDMGVNMMEGLALGITRNVGLASEAMSSAAQETAAITRSDIDRVVAAIERSSAGVMGPLVGSLSVQGGGNASAEEIAQMVIQAIARETRYSTSAGMGYLGLST